MANRIVLRLKSVHDLVSITRNVVRVATRFAVGILGVGIPFYWISTLSIVSPLELTVRPIEVILDRYIGDYCKCLVFQMALVVFQLVSYRFIRTVSKPLACVYGIASVIGSMLAIAYFWLSILLVMLLKPAPDA